MARQDLTLYQADGSQVAVPFRWIICDSCDGHGKSSRYLGAFSSDEMRDDPDFARAFLSGKYDRPCDGCGGTGKVKVADPRAMTPDMRRAWREQCRDDAEVDAIHRAEMRAECGFQAGY